MSIENDGENTPTLSAADLVSLYKRQGAFDSLKRKLLDDFMTSEANGEVQQAVREIVETEISNSPDILSQNPSNAASVLQGVIDKKSKTSTRQQEQVYRFIKEFLDERLVSKDLKNQVEVSMRQIEKEH